MKEQKLTITEETVPFKTNNLEKPHRVLSRPNSLRPMKSLMKIKSLRPNSQIVAGTVKVQEKLF
ncbi:MAG: hypothetical protein ACOYL6_07210 [Bacteriovoracaceae bacterium]